MLSSTKSSTIVFHLNIGSFDGNISGAYIFLIIVNIMIFSIMLPLGLIINYLSSMDPEELRDVVWCRAILGMYCKITPYVIKIVHVIKFGIYIILTILILINKIGTQGNCDSTMPSCDPGCSNSTRFNATLRPSYIRQLVIFHSAEGLSVIITMFVLCIIKTVLDINAFIYQPYNKNASRIKKLLLRHLGP
jgi:hypothetical protein